MLNFNRLYETIKEGKPHRLTKAEADRMEVEYQQLHWIPVITPVDFDCNVRGWMDRIKTWGKISIKHSDPENFRGKKKVSIAQMEKFVEDDELRKLMSHWNWEKKGLTKCLMFKDYIGKDGKVYTTSFFIKVKLNKKHKNLV